MKEIWKPIKDYEGFYSVSNLGNVYSHYIKRKMKLVQRGGYYVITLAKYKKKKKFSINVLVARTFLQNPNKYKEVNHIDGNKKNNRVNNLEWVSRKQNMKHAYDMKLAESFKIKVDQLTLEGEYIKNI